MNDDIFVRIIADGIPLIILIIIAFLYFKKDKS
jgi:hypothetical protein